MGWFCTTSFGGDAFQMGSVESFFTLLLSSLHLAPSLTAWRSLSLCLSLSAIAHRQKRSHTNAQCIIWDETHSGKRTQTFTEWAQMCMQICAHTNQTACGGLHVCVGSRHMYGSAVGATSSLLRYVHTVHTCSFCAAENTPPPKSLKYSSKCWCWTPALLTHLGDSSSWASAVLWSSSAQIAAFTESAETKRPQVCSITPIQSHSTVRGVLMQCHLEERKTTLKWCIS